MHGTHPMIRLVQDSCLCTPRAALTYCAPGQLHACIECVAHAGGQRLKRLATNVIMKGYGLKRATKAVAMHGTHLTNRNSNSSFWCTACAAFIDCLDASKLSRMTVESDLRVNVCIPSGTGSCRTKLASCISSSSPVLGMCRRRCTLSARLAASARTALHHSREKGEGHAC